jgi:hypothetical protein
MLDAIQPVYVVGAMLYRGRGIVVNACNRGVGSIKAQQQRRALLKKTGAWID